MVYTTAKYKKVLEVINNTEDKKKVLEDRKKEIEGLIASNLYDYEAMLLVDDKEAERKDKIIKELKTEQLTIESKLTLFGQVDKMDILKRDQDFKKLVDDVKTDNLKMIDELKIKYKKNADELLELKEEFLKRVARAGIIKKHSNSLIHEIHALKDKTENVFYSGVSADDVNLVSKSGTIFIDSKLSQSLFDQIEPRLEVDHKKILHDEMKNYSK